MAFDIFMICFLFIIGILVGLLAIIIGLKCPLKSKIINTCDCENTYKWYELIPIFSFFLSKGECPYCHKETPLIYSFLELLTGILYSLSYITYGFSYEMIIMLIIVFLMIEIYISDFKYYIILEKPLILFTIIILILKYLFFGLRTLLISICSGIILYVFAFIIRYIGTKIFKQEALGGGDVKLASFFGILFGLRLSILSLIVGSFLAFPIAIYYSLTNSKREIPFGPFLITGLFFIFIFMDQIRTFLSVIFK